MKRTILVLFGVLGLLIGALEYVSPMRIYGSLSQWLPDFFHAFSFSLISIGLFSNSRLSQILFCLLWFGLDSVFELGQRYGNRIASYIPGWFENLPLLRNTKNYFINGRFDVFDIVSISLAVLAAYLTAELILKGERDEGYAKI